MLIKQAKFNQMPENSSSIISSIDWTLLTLSLLYLDLKIKLEIYRPWLILFAKYEVSSSIQYKN